MPLLAMHGSGGGYDQGMAFAASLATRGIRVIAMSRFGYLRTPMPAVATAESQADAFVRLMDVLDIQTAAIWALWHLPLFYMAGTMQAEMPMALFLASCVALSVLFARLSVGNGFSVLSAIVLHWSVNAGAWAIPVTPQGGDVQPYVLVMSLLFVIAAVVFLNPDHSNHKRASDNDAQDSFDLRRHCRLARRTLAATRTRDRSSATHSVRR